MKKTVLREKNIAILMTLSTDIIKHLLLITTYTIYGRK